MPGYTGIPKEETLKSLVYADYFPQFGYEPNIDNIDFVITDKKARGDLFSDGLGSSRHYLWAEAKKGAHDVFDMFTQLLLTCKKTYNDGDYLAPPWLGVFDEARISFVSFHDILPIFTETDFNWSQTPCNHDTDDFIKAREKVKNLIGAKIVIFNFEADDREIKEFIKTHFIQGADASIKSPITKDNFVQIFYKWVKEVMPTINMASDEWAEYKKADILECDFFRADIMSAPALAPELGENANVFSTPRDTISDKLKIVLENDTYKLKEKTKFDRLLYVDIGFSDEGEAYRRFWNRYERPPAEIYHTYIIDRRDLLVPQNIRERKGSFFTPKIWADKSKEYLAAVLGANWQEEYYIWDCAAGSGNLLAGLTNPYNVWASDIEQANIDTMKAMTAIDENLNLLDAHIFQFDFLNDILTKEDYEWKKSQAKEYNLPAPEQRKLPQALCDIIDDPEKRKKLIVYINPPYAEATSAKTTTGTGKNKPKVATGHKTLDRYKKLIGAATNEISAHFMARIYHELPNCTLALFSKLKFVCTQNFIKFRKFFKANFKAGFVVHADTFDNVRGNFPIGFTIWDLAGKQFPKSIKVDVSEEGGEKIFWDGFQKSINQWIKQFDNKKTAALGYMGNYAPDFLKLNQPYITVNKETRHVNYFAFIQTNIIHGCIYLAVRLCIEPTWLNDRDQFYYPTDLWEKDTEFQHDCLAFALFHGQNRISCADGVNHWIPFAEKEVNAKEKFASNFMSAFLKDKTFSPEAEAVLDAGRELWMYYHEKIKTRKTAPVNASFYDIREFFQGRKENGTMNTKSNDETYNALIKTLREKQKTLAAKIEPKVYEYGFLRE
ncbi:MAG: hypothetical protein LBC77_03900 [Spirochaetaceae bacterium]|nr:hypothetical protein [Spirochaetaceae bacterium]